MTEKWAAINAIFLEYRRNRRPVRRKQLLEELRRAGAPTSPTELSELAKRFHFRQFDDFLEAD